MMHSHDFGSDCFFLGHGFGHGLVGLLGAVLLILAIAVFFRSRFSKKG